jgi:hypothetical protein
LGSTSQVFSQVITAATTTTLTSLLNPSFYGQSVTFTATVTSSGGTPPNGEIVTFEEGSTVLGTATLSGGSAIFSYSTLGVGTRIVKAVYSGDPSFTTSTSKSLDQVVNKATTTTTLASSQNPSAFNQSVTFTSTVTPQFSGTPTGNMTFKNGTVTLKGGVALSGGVATYTTTKLAVGTGSITAEYAGSTSFLSSTSPAVDQVVSPATTTTTLTSSLNPSNYGQSVTFTATLTAQFGGTVTGSVNFMDGTTLLKTVNLGAGKATYKTSTLATGTHNITAAYNGSTDYSTSSASLTQTVQ